MPCRSFETGTRLIHAFGASWLCCCRRFWLSLCFYPGAATAQQVNQIKLTEKHIQGFMTAYEKHGEAITRTRIRNRIRGGGAGEAVPRRTALPASTEYDDVSTNITMIMSGIDPQTKKFTEPPNRSE